MNTDFSFELKAFLVKRINPIFNTLAKQTALMIKINSDLKPADISHKLKRFWELSAQKIYLIAKNYDDTKGSPVFTVKGHYATRRPGGNNFLRSGLSGARTYAVRRHPVGGTHESKDTLGLCSVSGRGLASMGRLLRRTGCEDEEMHDRR